MPVSRTRGEGSIATVATRGLWNTSAGKTSGRTGLTRSKSAQPRPHQMPPCVVKRCHTYCTVPHRGNLDNIERLGARSRQSVHEGRPQDLLSPRPRAPPRNLRMVEVNPRQWLAPWWQRSRFHRKAPRPTATRLDAKGPSTDLVFTFPRSVPAAPSASCEKSSLCSSSSPP